MRLLLAASLVGSYAANAEAQPAEVEGVKPSRIEGRLDGDTARLSVRYLLHIGAATEGPTEQNDLQLPERGVVTGGKVAEGGVSHALVLTPAERASEEFHALWEKPAGRVKTWAAHLWSSSPRPGNWVSLELATPRRVTMVADIAIAVPACFRRDARYIAAPASWIDRIPIEQRGPATHEELDTACGGSEWPHVWMKFAARELASRSGGADRIGTHAGRLSLGTTQVVKLEMDLAAKVSDVPADLATAIVVDVSRSMDPSTFDAQRDTIAAYLRATANTRVQVIAYSRRARPLLPSWTVASQGATRIDRELRAIARSNGSNIAAGLQEAGKWLDQTTGTRRILLFTDENLSTQSELTRVIDDALPAHTLVHVVALDGGALARDDDAKLARLAIATRGMSVRGGELDTNDSESLDATLLARPITLDHVRVKTPGWQHLETERSCPDADDFATSLAEGESCTWWGQADTVSAPFSIEGMLWGERVTRVIRADLDRSVDVAREITMLRLLGDDLHKLAERAARAVNEVWSLYASWGGDDGYGEGFGGGGGGWGTICGGCRVGTIGRGSGTGFGVPSVDIEGAVARVVRTCKPDHDVEVDVETTLEEIVEVEVHAIEAETRHCVTEALWNAWLVIPGAPAHATTKVHVKV